MIHLYFISDLTSDLSIKVNQPPSQGDDWTIYLMIEEIFYCLIYIHVHTNLNKPHVDIKQTVRVMAESIVSPPFVLCIHHIRLQVADDQVYISIQ